MVKKHDTFSRSKIFIRPTTNNSFVCLHIYAILYTTDYWKMLVKSILVSLLLQASIFIEGLLILCLSRPIMKIKKKKRRQRVSKIRQLASAISKIRRNRVVTLQNWHNCEYFQQKIFVSRSFICYKSIWVEKFLQ